MTKIILFLYFLLFWFSVTFFIYIDFARIRTSNTAADDATNYSHT